MPASSFITDVVSRIDELVAVACPHAPEPGLLIGLSGGPDSVALLLAARDWSEQRSRWLAAAHLDHGLREASAADAAFCRDLCAGLDIPLHEQAVDARPVARARGRGLEEAGRHLRRRFFDRLLREEPGLDCVATGHHRDDQIETVVMRFFQGTGPEGLRGIRPVSGRYIHPLLEQDRGRILAFLEASGQPWRQDASNLEGDNTRARLRRELFPVVRGIFGRGCSDAPARLAGLLGDDLDILDALTAEARRRADAGAGRLGVSALQAMEPALARRVLRRWLAESDDGTQPVRLERVHMENLLSWLREGQSGTGLDLPAGWRLHRDFDALRAERTVTSAARDAADFRVSVDAGDHGTPTEDATDVGAISGPGPWRLVCPHGMLRGDVRVRNIRSGDGIALLGLDGTKKLSDLLRERQVAVHERSAILVVEDDEGILWVIGLARAERTRLLPDTTRMVTISVIRRAPPTQ